MLRCNSLKFEVYTFTTQVQNGAEINRFFFFILKQHITVTDRHRGKQKTVASGCCQTSQVCSTKAAGKHFFVDLKK